MVGHSAQILHALRAHPDPLGPQGRTDAGIFECVNTLTVLLPRIVAETPRRPCEAMTIRSQRFAPVDGTIFGVGSPPFCFGVRLRSLALSGTNAWHKASRRALRSDLPAYGGR
jgi:hypothetical protein